MPSSNLCQKHIKSSILLFESDYRRLLLFTAVYFKHFKAFISIFRDSIFKRLNTHQVTLCISVYMYRNEGVLRRRHNAALRTQDSQPQYDETTTFSTATKPFSLSLGAAVRVVTLMQR